MPSRLWLAVIPALLLSACLQISVAEYNPAGTKSALVVADTTQTARDEVLAAGGTVSHSLPVLNAVGAKLPADAIEKLSLNTKIRSVVIDENLPGDKLPSSPESNQNSKPQMRDPVAPPQNYWLTKLLNRRDHRLTGEGIGIAIIDTGIAANDPEIGWLPNVIARYNSITDTEGGDVNDATGHGTHISSLIYGNGKSLQGIAPNAALAVVKAFDTESHAYFLDVIRAVQWVIENKNRLGIRVLNMSVSASSEIPYFADPLNQAVTAAWNSGLVVVVSAGNRGPEPHSVTAPGNNPWVITVGAASFTGTSSSAEVPHFSGRGPTTLGHIKPNLVAPGVRLAGYVGDKSRRPSNEAVELTENGLWVASGASQASAVVAGMVTLLLEARPELSNHDVKCILANSATPLTSTRDPTESPMTQGRGLINITSALASTATDCEERLDRFSPETVIEGAYRSS